MLKTIISPAIIFSLGTILFSSCGAGDKKPEAETEKAQQKPNINLSGNFINSAQETVVLCYLPVAGEQVIDSAKIDEAGNFKFKNLHIPGVGFYTLKIDNQNFAPLILDENQTVKVTGDAKRLGYTYLAEGSQDTKIFQDISELSMRHKGRMDSLGVDFQNKLGNNTSNKKLFEELSMKYEMVYNGMNDNFYKQLIAIVDANPNSLACITGVAQLDPSMYIDNYKKLDDALTKKYANYNKVTTFHDQVVKYVNLAIGSMAPDITLQDPQGNVVSLSSMKGKVVMLDFWASWCKPCRKENPNVVKMYNKFKGKGFEIYGVSLDENKDEWVKAITNDELTWKHVCDFGGWYSAAAKTYDVTSIPFTVLITKEGRIANKGLRGEALEKSIKTLLGS